MAARTGRAALAAASNATAGGAGAAPTRAEQRLGIGCDPQPAGAAGEEAEHSGLECHRPRKRGTSAGFLKQCEPELSPETGVEIISE